MIVFLWFPSKIKAIVLECLFSPKNPSWRFCRDLFLAGAPSFFCGFIWISFRAGYSSMGESWSHANQCNLSHFFPLKRWWFSMLSICFLPLPCLIVSVNVSIYHLEVWSFVAEAHLSWGLTCVSRDALLHISDPSIHLLVGKLLLTDISCWPCQTMAIFIQINLRVVLN